MQKAKIILSVCVLFSIVVHFVLVFAFINPVKRAEGRFHYYAMFYLYPFFDQGWNLFAPVPHSNYHLYVKYKQGSEIKQFDLVDHIQNHHASNRLGGYETLSLALSNSIHNFEYSTSLHEKINGPIRDDINYLVVQHFANAFVNALSDGQAKDLHFILMITNVETNAQQVYY